MRRPALVVLALTLTFTLALGLVLQRQTVDGITDEQARPHRSARSTVMLRGHAYDVTTCVLPPVGRCS